MPQASDTPSPKHTLPQIYLFSLFSAYILLILLHRAVPLLGDYSIWTYEGVLFRNHLLGVADAFHTLKHYPVPNSATTLGIGLLALAMPWQMAAKLWLCLHLAFSAFALRSLLRATKAPAALWFILPSATFLNLNLWWGSSTSNGASPWRWSSPLCSWVLLNASGLSASCWCCSSSLT